MEGLRIRNRRNRVIGGKKGLIFLGAAGGEIHPYHRVSRIVKNAFNYLVEYPGTIDSIKILFKGIVYSFGARAIKYAYDNLVANEKSMDVASIEKKSNEGSKRKDMSSMMAIDSIPHSKRQKLNYGYKVYGSGTYRGTVGKKKRYGKGGKCKTNSTEKTEINGTVTDGNVCYVGIGPNVGQSIVLIWRQMYKCALNKHGEYFSNWDTPVNSRFVTELEYRNDISDITLRTSQYNSPNPTTFSHKTAVDNIFGQFQTDLAAAPAGLRPIFLKFKFRNEAGAPYPYQAEIDLKHLKIKLHTNQTLLLQNQTLGGGIGDTSKDDVTSNPVHCSVFKKKGNMILQKQPSANYPATYKGFCTLGQPGYRELIVRTATNNFTAADAPIMNANVFDDVKKRFSFNMNPGSMKKFVQVFDNFKSFQSWMDLFYEFVPVASPNLPFKRVYYGNLSVFSFDKMIDTGEDVNIAYELNQTIRSGYKYYSQKYTFPEFISVEVE